MLIKGIRFYKGSIAFNSCFEKTLIIIRLKYLFKNVFDCTVLKYFYSTRNRILFRDVIIFIHTFVSRQMFPSVLFVSLSITFIFCSCVRPAGFVFDHRFCGSMKIRERAFVVHFTNVQRRFENHNRNENRRPSDSPDFRRGNYY